MNTDGDYLWNKSGEPDPEIQQLEEILGTLRYQPRSLEIPTALQPGRERGFFRGFAPRLAIAATIVMLLLGVGLWLGLQRLQRNRQAAIAGTSNTPAMRPSPAAASDPNPSPDMASSSGHDQEGVGTPDGRRVSQSLLAGNATRTGNVAHEERLKNQLLAMKKRREAEAAKDQLMLALRLASAKLNFAQKKTQNLRDEVHNQHKIG